MDLHRDRTGNIGETLQLIYAFGEFAGKTTMLSFLLDG
jgi:hypothetical protein